MLTDTDLEFVYSGTPGVALVWVIGEDCVYDEAMTTEHAEIFLKTNNVKNITPLDAMPETMVVELYKDNDLLETLTTSDYFGSILLSNPIVLNLADYPNGRKVESPHAKFIDNDFLILDY
jgi:hypothetical protein